MFHMRGSVRQHGRLNKMGRFDGNIEESTWLYRRTLKFILAKATSDVVKAGIQSKATPRKDSDFVSEYP